LEEEKVPFKVCPYCGKKSYSATENPKFAWVCPYCNADLSQIESFIHDPDQDKEKKE